MALPGRDAGLPDAVESPAGARVPEGPLRRRRGICAALLWLSVGLISPACGPIAASSAVGEAEESLAAAQLARAHRLAPYTFWLSASYLNKAKLLEGYSEFEQAEEYAELAAEFASKATEEANEESLRQRVLQERIRANQGGK